MRLDYFLKLSRLVKRRPLAKEMCDKNLLSVNDQIAKAAKPVEVGDIMLIKYPHRTLKVRVEQIPGGAVSKKDAASLYTVLEEIHKPEDDVLW